MDHINGKREDNRLENLRLVNHSQNSINKKGIRGYEIHKVKNKIYYRGSIMKNGKHLTKCFPFTDQGKQKALKWRVCKEIELFGKFANRICTIK